MATTEGVEGMLRLVLEPVLGDRVMTARVEGHCGAQTWRFCLAQEGIRIIENGVWEGAWGWRETRSLCEQIEARLPSDNKALEASLRRFDALSQRLGVVFRIAEGQKMVWLKSGGVSLHALGLPTIGSCIDVLLPYFETGRLNSGDCLHVLQQVVLGGMSDTICDQAFDFMVRGRRRSLVVEGLFRQEIVNS